MTLALLFSAALFLLIFPNLAHLFGLSPWLGLLPPLLLLPLPFYLRTSGADLARRQSVVQGVLSALNQLTLLLVAAALALRANVVLGGSVAAASVGPVLPLFIAALALYTYHVFLARRRKDMPGSDRMGDLLLGPPLLPTLCAALILSAYLLLLLDALRAADFLGSITVRFLERGIIPPITLLLFCWALLLLAYKGGTVGYLRRVLGASILPDTISTGAGGSREVLDERFRYLWRRSEESYLVPRFISWAVPILGFIGTVLGISLAADGIRNIVGSQAGLSGLSSDLGAAIAPLGIAFDTTLIALSLSVVLTLLQTLVQRAEESALVEIEDRVRKDYRAAPR